jgi:hypothetical protein
VLTILKYGSIVNEMAIQDDKYLACMLENQIIVIWDIKTSSKHLILAICVLVLAHKRSLNSMLWNRMADWLG